MNWERVLASQGVPFVTSGPNVSRGNIAVHCPFCGGADPSQHMSISVDGQGWRCFRHPDHRGRSPVRLLAALLRCSPSQAAALAGARYLPSDLLSRVRNALDATDRAPDPARPLDLPAEFRPFGSWKISERPHRAYLRSRGYDSDEIDRMTRDYGLYYCASGPFAGRVIFPVYDGGRLVSWTGRAISRRAELRYKTLGAGEEDDPRAVGPITNYLLWADQLARGGESLLICEGPFDALRARVLGRGRVAATCLFTVDLSASQEVRLHELCPRFHSCHLVLDSDALGPAVRLLLSRLAQLGVRLKALPEGTKDPGELLRSHADWLRA